MGNSYSDQNIKLFMSADREIYTAGEMVDGSTKIVARSHLPYTRLILKLECFEYCQWNKHASSSFVDTMRFQDFSGHNRLFYQVHSLAQFPGGLRMGFYVFPFSIRIPSDLPGSLITGYSSIAYVLSTYLTYDNSQLHPECSCVINVTEPPRLIPTRQKKRDTANMYSCSCLSRGTTMLDVDFTRNLATAGEPLAVEITTDNRHSQRAVLNTKVQLIGNSFLQSDKGKSQNIRTIINEKDIGAIIPAKAANTSRAVLEIPPNLAHSTSIGYNIAYYYTLQISNQMESGCCGSKQGPLVKQHIYLKALQPVLEKRMREEVLPPDWAPIVSSKRVFSEPMKANIRPNPKIQAMNQPYSSTFL